jgi:hypothetical protein
MRQVLMVIAIMIGFVASFSAGVYTGAILKTETKSKSTSNMTDTQNAISPETSKKKEPKTAIQDPTSQVRSVEAPVTIAQSKASDQTKIALPPPPKWLKVTLDRARTDTSIASKSLTLNPESTLLQDGKLAAGGPKAALPLNTKSYVIQTKHQIPVTKLNKMVKIIQTLKFEYSLVGTNSESPNNLNYIRILGFTERLSANKAANILTSKTGQKFITLRISNLR